MIKAEIVAHSLSPQGDELMSVLCTFPRIILAEVNTHRRLSKNTSSSRAIPFNKMVEVIEKNPFIPIAWQKEHSGMQGTEYWSNEIDIAGYTQSWLGARDMALESAQELSNTKITKQLVNRLLEPFMWTTMLITGSKEGWDNFFKLRCPNYEINCGPDDTDDLTLCTGKSWKELMLDKGCLAGDFNTDNILERLSWNKGQAEIHIMDLAEKIYDARNESTPKQLKAGEWHIPFKNKFDTIVISNLSTRTYHTKLSMTDTQFNIIKTSVAMGARTSYTIIGEEKEINYENMIALHDRLINQDPPHSSPFEHTARAMTNEEHSSFIKGKCTLANDDYDSPLIVPVLAEGWCYNLKGFISYRYLIDNKLEL